MWLGGSYFLSLYLFFSQPFMCLMHSDCGVRHLLGSGTVSPTHTWQFCKKRSALSHLDLMSVTQKWAVLKKKIYQMYFPFTAMMKQTHWALWISLLYVTNWCNNFTASPVSRDLLPFSLPVTQKSLGLPQPQTMLYISVSKEMFNDSHISPFHVTQRKTQKCMTRSQQTSHQLCLGDWGRRKMGEKGTCSTEQNSLQMMKN